MSIATTHQNYSPHWWTPQRWLDWVQATLGNYLDMCPQNWEDRDEYEKTAVGFDALYDALPVYCNHPGVRGSTKHWWTDFTTCQAHRNKGGIWCAFSIEQLRHMNPSLFDLDGWLVMPKRRIGFVWGGPTLARLDGAKKGKLVVYDAGIHDESWIARRHGDPAKSPGNWTVFWTSKEPAETPEDCDIVRTGTSVSGSHFYDGLRRLGIDRSFLVDSPVLPE